MALPNLSDLTSHFAGLGSAESEGNWQRFPIPSTGLSVSLQDVSTVLFGEDLLPVEFPVGPIKLTGLRVNFAAGQEELQFALGGSTGQWTFIPSFLEVNGADWKILGRVRPDRREAVLSFGFRLGQADIQGLISLPDVTFSGVVTSANKNTGLFGALITSAFEFLPTAPPLPNLNIRSLSFTAAPQQKSFSFDVAVADVWDQPDIDFHLTDIALTASREGAAGDDPGETSLALSAKATFAGAAFSVSGSFVSEAGWTLTGSADGLRIESALAALHVDTSTLPAFVKSLEVTSASVTLETKSKNFTFGFGIKATSFPFEVPAGAPVALRIDCSVTQSGPHFTGQLTVGELDFTLTIDGNRAVGIFADPDGLVMNLGDMLNALSAGAEVARLGNSIDLIVNGAVFAFLGKQGGLAASNKARFMLGLELANHINLSQLPLIGGQFPANETLDAAYRLVFSSGSIGATELDFVNQIVTGKNLAPLPTLDPSARFAVGVKVNIGGVPLDVAVPVASSATPAAPAANAAVPASPAANNINWIEIQRDFGPAHFGRAGIAFGGGTITFALDASIKLGPLSFSLLGLSVTSPLSKFQPTFSLDGIGIAFEQNPVSISGTFLRQVAADGTTTYAGAAVIALKAGNGGKAFSLTAFGAYTEGKDPSLFIYAVLDRILGGPSFFFVTGLAAGFGYNRDLIAPAIEGVSNFPLLKAAAQPGNFGTVEKILPQMLGVLPPKTGTYWLAAGVRFDSFKIIHSTALLLVKFGNNFELTLLGLSTFQLPEKLAAGISPYVNVELAFMVAIRPAEGLVAAQARLTDNSYVIDKSCRLTGGFAFFVWYDGPHNGDFVLTVGGYHPRFTVPAHYPNVPRLGLTWTIDKVSIKGEAYFALTPSAVMAGGALEVSYRDGTVYASLTARADFLIQWKPFFYSIDVFLSITAGISFDTIFGTADLSTTLSAGVHIEGPEFSGSAHVSWGALSFDVNFGKEKQTVTDLTWADFREAFLPADTEICKIKIVSGLVSELPGPGGTGKEFLVRPDELAFSTETVIPARALFFGTDTNEIIKVKDNERIGIRRLRTGPLESTHTVSLNKLRDDSSTTERVEDLRFRWTFDSGGRRLGVPKELWDTAIESTDPQPSADVLTNRLVGVGGLRPVTGLSRSNPPLLDIIGAFRFATASTPFGLSVKRSEPEAGEIPAAAIGTVDTSANAYRVIEQSIAAGPITSRRGAMITALRGAGFAELSNGPLTDLAGHVRTVLQFAPLLGGLGSAGVQKPQIPVPIDLGQQPLPEAVSATLIELIAEIFQRIAAPAAAAADVVSDEPQQINASAGVTGTLELKNTGETVQILANDDAAGAPKQRLSFGQTQVWSLTRDEGSPQADLSASGGEGMSLRIVALDELGQLLKDDEAAITAQMKLPAGAARVAITGFKAGVPARTVFGWHANSQLIQVSSRTFLAEGSTVRVETSLATRLPGQPTVRLLEGSRAVQENVTIVRESDAVVERGGFFRTELPAGLQTLAVFVRQGEVNAAPTLGTALEVTRTDDGARLRLDPMFVLRESESEFLLLCKAPPGLAASAAGRISFEVRAAGGASNWTIAGVQGMNASVFQVRNNRNSFRLEPRVSADGGPAPTDARIGFVKAVA